LGCSPSRFGRASRAPLDPLAPLDLPDLAAAAAFTADPAFTTAAFTAAAAAAAAASTRDAADFVTRDATTHRRRRERVLGRPLCRWRRVLREHVWQVRRGGLFGPARRRRALLPRLEGV